MDKSLYDSEQTLKKRLESAQAVLAKLEGDLQKLNDEKAVKGAIKGATAVVASVACIINTVEADFRYRQGGGLETEIQHSLFLARLRAVHFSLSPA